MKKSFCDICGEEADASYRTQQPFGKKPKITVCLTFDFREREDKPPRFADLCKKCARELLDKIEL